jgi:hypothetical protein
VKRSNDATLSDKARKVFLKVFQIGEDPLLDTRDPDVPIGLKVRPSFVPPSRRF